MSLTVNMMAAPGNATPNVINAALGAVYTPNANGIFAVAVNDTVDLVKQGLVFAENVGMEYYNPSAAPAAASAAATVASASLANGPLTIAAQPDVVRPLAIVFGAGTTAITSGTLSIGYYANDGTLQLDTFSLIVAAAGAATTPSGTFTTSKGALKVTTAFISGLAGGTSPFVYIGTTASLALPVAPGFVGLTVFSEKATGTDETVGSVNATNGVITPTSAPNATRIFSFGYTFTVPS